MIASLRLSDGSQTLRHRHLASIASTVVVCLLVAVLVVLVTGALLGYRAFTIMSGSMTPTIGVGDMVVDTSVRPLAVHPGEIITFRDPALGQRLVTHRVVSVRPSGPQVLFVTKGDANVVTEHWSVAASGHVGLERLLLPRAGRIVADLNSPLARALEVALVALCVAHVGLRWIWRQPGPAIGN
jgi:signal peptidase